MDEVSLYLREKIEGELLHHLVENHKGSWLKEQFLGKRSRESIWDMYKRDKDVRAYIDRLEIEISFLPKELSFEKSSLSVGNKVFQVVANDVLSKGMEIKEWTVAKKVANPIFKEKSMSEVLGYDPYIVTKDNCGNDLLFYHNDRDGFSSYSDKHEPVYLFTEKSDALKFYKNKVTELQQQGQSYQLPRPA